MWFTKNLNMHLPTFYLSRRRNKCTFKFSTRYHRNLFKSVIVTRNLRDYSCTVQKLRSTHRNRSGFEVNLFDFCSFPIMELLELGVLCHRAIENVLSLSRRSGMMSNPRCWTLNLEFSVIKRE